MEDFFLLKVISNLKKNSRTDNWNWIINFRSLCIPSEGWKILPWVQSKFSLITFLVLGQRISDNLGILFNNLVYEVQFPQGALNFRSLWIHREGWKILPWVQSKFSLITFLVLGHRITDRLRIIFNNLVYEVQFPKGVLNFKSVCIHKEGWKILPWVQSKFSLITFLVLGHRIPPL